MGGRQSRHERATSSHYASSYSHYGTPQVQPSSPNSSYSFHSARHVDFDRRSHVDFDRRSHVDFDARSQIQSRYSRIGDDYYSVDQVTQALAQAGLESSNLIVGIDFTKSNEWTGSRSFNRKSLHHIGDTPNPYEQAISIIGRTLSAFDEDNLIPCYGFGDASTHDQEVFSFYSENRPCNGFEEVLSRYRDLTPQVRLAGPTSFAPIIETAIGIVDNSGGQYHVLVIIADGQVTRSVDTGYGQLSPQERNTIDAIVRASNYPLSIVLVGVGDGPWDMMHKFDDNIPHRTFDNFQFVNFTDIMLKQIATTKKEAEFALAALMEIPTQYKATIDFQLLGCRRGAPVRSCLPPPAGRITPNPYPLYQQSRNDEQISGIQSAPYGPTTNHSSNTRNCPVCMWTTKDLAFGCGHQTCYECGRDLELCPICRTRISTRIRLYE